jgi:predicted nucleic-acid-binding protein
VIALDTNVLVRFLVEDDRAQTRRARKLIQAAIREGEPCFVPEIVLCETVWVLDVSYRVSRADIAAVLRRLFAARQVKLEAPDLLARALAAFESGSGDFADYLIRERAKAAGCNEVATFDKKLLKDDMFVSP